MDEIDFFVILWLKKSNFVKSIGGIFMALKETIQLTGGADFSQLYLPLDGNHYATLADAQAATATIAYGSFLTQVLDFLIVAIVIFAALKVLVKLKRPAAPVEEAPTTKVCPFCKSEIAIEATRCPHCTSQLEG